MDNSVIEISDDSVEFVDSKIEDKENKLHNKKATDGRRKQTKGGVKLDDTIDLESSDDEREIGDGASDKDDRTEHFTTARDDIVSSTPMAKGSGDVTAFRSFVTSTPAAVVNDDNEGSYEQSETVRMDDIAGEIKDEMCDSYEEKVSMMTSTVFPESGDSVRQDSLIQDSVLQDSTSEKTLETANESSNASAELASESHQNYKEESSDSYEEQEEVSVASQSPLEDERADDEMSEGEDSLQMSMPSKKSRQMDPAQLPDTCTMLTAPNNGRVYLVGTAHFSEESQADVAAVIQAVQPDIVVLELCKSRTSILQMDEETSLELAQQLTVEKMIEMIRSQGAVQGMMTITMLSMSAHLTKELGMAPGGEFRRAYHEAKSIPGCLVHLGDRPVNVTLRRAVGSLSLWQMLRLGFSMLTSKASITKDEVEKYKQKDILEAMLLEMSAEYPNFTRVLVEERDVYLAHSLMLAADGPWRVSPQIQWGPEEAPVVVGVVGIGHVQGIVDNWNKVKPEDVARVVRIPPMPRSQRWARTALKTSFVLLSLYGGYRLCRNPINKIVKSLMK